MAELARLSFEVSSLCGPLDEAAFNWQPGGGAAWSVGQCVEHLVKANRVYLDALEEAAGRARRESKFGDGGLRPGRLGEWFLRSQEPPVRRRYKAAKRVLPARRCLKTATLVAFAGEQQRLIELVRSTADLDCDGVKFQNPLAYGLRVFNLSTGLLVVAAHERRHLWQARNVVALPDFPEG